MSDKKLCEVPLDKQEADKWLEKIYSMLEYAGSPGDWGRGTKLGDLIINLHDIKADILSQSNAAR